MFVVQIKNTFVEENIFSLIFWFRPQFFLSYKTFDSTTWRNELNLQKQTNVHKFKKIPCSLKKIIVKGRQDAECKKRKTENMVRRSDWYLN